MIHIRVNQGPAERIARFVLGLMLLFPGWEEWLPLGVALLLWGLGIVALFTALTGWCPVYSLLGRDRHASH